MDVRLPRLGEGADSGTVAALMVKVGDEVKADQPFLEIESDKAIATIPSPAAGIVRRILVKEGDTVKVGQVIGSLDALAAPATPIVSVPQAPRAPAPPDLMAAAAAAEVAPRSEVDHRRILVDDAQGSDNNPPKTTPSVSPPPPSPAVANGAIGPAAAPSVRKIARELGIDLARVQGTERGGRIVLADLRAYIRRLEEIASAAAQNPAVSPAERPTASAPPAPSPSVSVDFSQWGPVRTEKLTRLRRTIADRMVESWTTIPHVTQFGDADITRLSVLRKKHAPKYEKRGARLTLTVFAIKLLADALKKHPKFNASIDDASGSIVYKDYCHVGVAVDTEHGLFVPVLRDVDKKSLLEIALELASVADKAKHRKLAIEDMQGGTFSLSNQGGIGGTHFTPIINKPQVAILGMGRGTEVLAASEDGKVVVRTRLPLALSYDHRLIDGADAARFITHLLEAFQSWKDADIKL